jgi:hypothetical protein
MPNSMVFTPLLDVFQMRGLEYFALLFAFYIYIAFLKV